ncbi:MAG: hypothetical protein ACW98D_20435 [Promethearchaeota archaeon]|jgi:hypothetical protein
MSELKKTKNYFNEEEFQEMLFEYQDVTETDPEDIKHVLSTDRELEKKLLKEIKKIVNAIIIVYRYYIFEDYDDLMQHGLNACYTNFMKFKPEKGTAFNYFSIIAKISLLNYTDRKKKHRNHQNIEDFNAILENREEINYDLFFDNLEDTLFGIIDGNYLGKKRGEYTRIASLIIDYLRKTQTFISKSDLYTWGRSYAIKNNQIREFVNEMSKYNTEIFEGVR